MRQSLAVQMAVVVERMRTVGHEHRNRQLFGKFCPQGLDCRQHSGRLRKENQNRKKAFRLQQMEERPKGLLKVQRGDFPPRFALSIEVQVSVPKTRPTVQCLVRRRVFVKVFHGDGTR